MNKSLGILWGTPDNASIVEKVLVDFVGSLTDWSNNGNDVEERVEARFEGIRFESGWILYVSDGQIVVLGGGKYVGQENGLPVYLLDDTCGVCKEFDGDLSDLLNDAV